MEEPKREKIETLSGGSMPPDFSRYVPESGRTLEEEASVLNRKLMVFGTDVASIPCFRNSFLYGILSGFGAGVGYFAFTSKVVKATSVGFYSYVGVTLIYWIQCRWNFSQTKFQYQQLQYAMQQNARYAGTEKAMKQIAAQVNLDFDEEKLKKS